MKTLEVQFAKLVSVPVKVQIHRQSKVPKVPMRACHPHGGAHARPVSNFEEWSHYTKFIILFRNFTMPCSGKFTSKSWTETIRNLKVHKAVHCVHLKIWPSKAQKYTPRNCLRHLLVTISQNAYASQHWGPKAYGNIGGARHSIGGHRGRGRRLWGAKGVGQGGGPKA